MPPYTEYPAAIALFTSGRVGDAHQQVWEVPTFTDLAAQKKLGFEWGAVELPVFFNHACTYSDSHSFAIPNNQGKPQTAEKHAAVLEVIKWMENHALFWATAGHIPANKHVTNSADYQAMQPQATYAVLTANMIVRPEVEVRGRCRPDVLRRRQCLHGRRQWRGGSDRCRRPDEGRARRDGVTSD